MQRHQWASSMRHGFRKGSLTRRYAGTFGAVALALVTASGLTEMLFGYREARTHMAQMQRLQAGAAAREIEQYLRNIEDGLRDADKLPWGTDRFGLDSRRDELNRLFVLQPSVTEASVIDAQGRELLYISRTATDRQGGGTATDPALFFGLQPGQARYGPTFYEGGSDPLIHLSLASTRPAGETTIATINLRFLADVVSGLRVGEGGHTYLIDSADRLVAHPEPSSLLRQPDLSGFEPLLLARASTDPNAQAALLDAADTVSLDNAPVIATAVRLDRMGWLLFVEQPRAEALAPALATLKRTLVLLVVAAALAVLASVLAARRLANPIVSLRRATEQIAAGNWRDKLLLPDSSEELQGLADDFRRMAQRLAELYEGLEAQVEARTMELSKARDLLQTQADALDHLNQRLVDQLGEVSLRKDEAERANSAKTRFLAAASHDLRQPMHTIGLLLAVLAGRLREADQRAIADKLGATVETMERLFSSLLDISKLDAGAVQVAWETFPVQDLLTRIGQRFELPAAERGLGLRVRPCTALVRSDPGLLERCLGNLVANALSYTTTGRVVVGCRRRGEMLAIQVHDTGPGIAAEHLSMIFEEFVRLPEGAASQAKGLGLGLAIVRRTADLLQHRLNVKSMPGRGSMFEISLSRPVGSMIEEPRADACAREDAPLRGIFVLVVDDDEGNRAALQALCTRWGCQVATAPDAQAAMTELGRHLRAPDILLTDLKLGGSLDGLALVAGLREALGEPLPCVLITADTAASVQARAQALGVDVLHKPATPERILATTTAALQRPAPDPSGAALVSA